MATPPPLSSFRVRPRFEHALAVAPEAARARILAGLTRCTPRFEVHDFPGFIGLHLPPGQRRYWSPRLFIMLDPAPDGTTRVTGTYGPEIEVWGVFLYGYLITGLLGTFSGVFGGAQMLVGSEPWAFWITGSMGVIAGVLYLGAQLGQKLGAAQTYQLHEAYRAAVGPIADEAAAGAGERTVTMAGGGI